MTRKHWCGIVVALAVGVVFGFAPSTSIATPVTWTGYGMDDYWNTAGNWSCEPYLPVATDDVEHDNADTIELNMGDSLYPVEIKSFSVDGSLGGGLQMNSEKGLRVLGDFVNDVAASLHYELSMGSMSYLNIAPASGTGNIERVDTNMTAGTSWLNPTTLDVSGAIIGGDFYAEQFCLLEVGTGTSPDRSQLYGTWELDGAHAWFAKAESIPETPLRMTLANGAKFDVEDTSYGSGEGGALFCSTFGSYFPEHELVYDGAGNELEVGVDGATTEHHLWVGDHTRIRAADEDSELTLDLYGALCVDSYFASPWVYQGWDTRNVDIIAEPTFDTATDGQLIEMISPVFSPYYDTMPVIFLDVPCHGAWRDLIIPDRVTGTPQEASLSYFNDNAVIDDGAFPTPLAPRDVGDFELGLFRNVTIGADRELDVLYDFEVVCPVIYYYGELTIDPTAEVSVMGTPLEKLVPPLDVEDLIVPACGTIYGDWNGDCAISNIEGAALQTAIMGGAATYNPLMDYDCDGQLTVAVEVAAMLANAIEQPDCDCSGGGSSGPGGILGASAMSEGGSLEGEPLEASDDVEDFAEWLTEVLTEEELAAFVADLDDAAERFAGEPVGADMIELLYYLQ